MEFSANFCDYSRIISDSEGKEIKQIIVDPLFGGEAVNLSAFVVNNTPESCEYRVTRKKGSGDDNIVLITPEQIGKDDS